jgi:FMN-dependent NADH-azoreductase
MHHLLLDEKQNLYEQIKKSLKKGGKYIEGDCSVSIEKERQFLEEYKEKIKSIELSSRSLYHIDIPFSLETQESLFRKSGFKEFEMIWKENEAAIYVVK